MMAKESPSFQDTLLQPPLSTAAMPGDSQSQFSKPFFLGLDASTQALKASLLSNDLDVISEIAVNFDVDLPQYGTKGGVLMGKQGSGTVYSPIMMVVEAMDLLLDRMREKRWELHEVRGVAAAGQVHQSVCSRY